jgi:protein gp37
MGDNSKIEWTDATWNPVAGCAKVSPGCKHCYAMRQAHRMSFNPNPKIAKRYEGLTHIVNGHPEWTGAARLNEDVLELPLRWRRPRRIFVNSLSDLFQDTLPDEVIDRVFAVMVCCPQHEFQVLTKRETRLSRWALRKFRVGDVQLEANHLRARRVANRWTETDTAIWPPPNVRIGVSIEDQTRAYERFDSICELGETGWNTMVSLEPLLGPVRIPQRYLALGRSAWVITGGESGPGARPAHPQWLRDVRDQCVAAGVPFFFKQWGEYTPMTSTDGVAGSPFGGHTMFRVGKKAAGALLDGREWREFPCQ